MMTETTNICGTAVPALSGDREALTMEEREDSLYKALQWVRDELSTLKSQDQSLMRQFSSLRSKINMIKDELPGSIDRSSTISFNRNSTISFTSPKPSDDEDVFFAHDDMQTRVNSERNFRTKSYSSGSEEEKL